MTKRIAIIGLPFFGVRVARTLREGGFDADYLPNPGRDLKRWPATIASLLRADLVYCIGSSVDRRGAPALLALARKKILMHWAGSDVLHALEAAKRNRASQRLLREATHWAVAPWLADELAPLGVRAEYRPNPVPLKPLETPPPFPEEFRALLYIPRNAHRAYDVEGYLSLIEAVPEIQFVVVGGYDLPRNYPNVEDAGYVNDMQAMYGRVSALVRLVHHDGMAQSVLEALSAGRPVIWNYHIPGVTRVASADEAACALRELAAKPPELNEAGIEATKEFLAENLVDDTIRELRRIIS